MPDAGTHVDESRPTKEDQMVSMKVLVYAPPKVMYGTCHGGGGGTTCCGGQG